MNLRILIDLLKWNKFTYRSNLTNNQVEFIIKK